MDLFKVLGISKEASDSEVKKAYRRKARDFHPDKNSDTKAITQFHKLQDAYEQLKTAEGRANHLALLTIAREKQEREQTQSQTVKRFKAELLRREQEAKKQKEDLPQKRSAAETKKSYQNNVIEVKWKDMHRYTEHLLREIFSNFGPVKNINIEEEQAQVEFLYGFSVTKCLAHPPEEFSVRKLDQCFKKSQKPAQRSGIYTDNSLVSHRMRALKHKLKSTSPD